MLLKYVCWRRVLRVLWTVRRSNQSILKEIERLLLNDKTLRFLASGGDEFNLGPEMRLDHSEFLCNRVLLKYKGDRESF